MTELSIEKQIKKAIEDKKLSKICPIFDIPEGTKIISSISEGKFWIWKGNYYEPICGEWLKARVRKFYPTWKPSKITNYLSELAHDFYKGDKKTKYRNPRGINCVNGVLSVDRKTGELVFRDHNPETDFFFEEPLVKYDESADTSQAERLLQCLEPEQAEILLRTLAAVIDLEYVKSKRNRVVKALFLQGKGNNGKDTLRAVTELIWGKSRMAHISPEALDHAGTSHNYFGIAGLYGASINWCSEVKVQKAVEENSFLKALITGDPLPYRQMQKLPEWYSPCCISLFGTNHDIYNNSLGASFSSRFGLLTFDKTYSDKPRPELGELKADPRFRDDPDFIKNEVLPGFLKLIVECWQPLLTEGIDWKVSDENWDEQRSKMSHLNDFIKETGLHYDPEYAAKGFGVTTAEIWEQLSAYYTNEGIMDKDGKVTAPDPRKGDTYIRHSKSIIDRFIKLFPNAKLQKRVKIYVFWNKRTSISYFQGLRFDEPIVYEDKVPCVENESFIKVAGKPITVIGYEGETYQAEFQSEEFSWLKTHQIKKVNDGEWVVEPLPKQEIEVAKLRGEPVKVEASIEYSSLGYWNEKDYSWVITHEIIDGKKVKLSSPKLKPYY